MKKETVEKVKQKSWLISFLDGIINEKPFNLCDNRYIKIAIYYNRDFDDGSENVKLPDEIMKKLASIQDEIKSYWLKEKKRLEKEIELM